jgi:hypothetical protein
MRRSFSLLVASLFAFSLVASSAILVGPVAAATIAPTTTCSNGVDDTPGLGLICEVTIVNHITPTGGTADVTIRECHGAAGDPTAACTTTSDTVNAPVTHVTQCNAATNGGGGTLRCSVDVTNRFVRVSTGQNGVTINQCVGSGDGIANTCDPFPANTSGAVITQCNGSANGGTVVQLHCTASGSSASGLDVVINQCNGSTNGGGALVICSATIHNVITAGPTPTPTPRPTPRATPRATATPTPRPIVGGAGVATPRPKAGTGTEKAVTPPTTPRSTAPPTDTAGAPLASASGSAPWALIALTVVLGLGALLLSPAGRRTVRHLDDPWV